jgi:hypothetical protein
MNWKGCGKKLPWFTAWRYPGINLDRITKTTKNYRQKNRYRDGDLKLELLRMSQTTYPLGCHIHRHSIQFKQSVGSRDQIVLYPSINCGY